MLRIANSYLFSAANISIAATTFGKIIAYGYLDYICAPGYASNPTIGTRLTCSSNGSWSPLPVCQRKCLYCNKQELTHVCLAITRCSSALLLNFLDDQSVSLALNGSYSLSRDQTDSSYVVSGTFVPTTCRTGYVNTAGPLNITCVNGGWTPFPNCTLSTSPVPINANADAPCPADAATYSIENGFLTRSSTFTHLDPTYRGWLAFICKPGYMIDPAIGAFFKCVNGVWSTKPRCISMHNCDRSPHILCLSSRNG